MDRLLYLAMNGAKQVMVAQSANAHNLANVNTAGFRADFNHFRAMAQFGPGAPSRVWVMSERPGIDFSFGSMQQTGRELDVAVAGHGWLAVQAPDGSEAYTRAGDLRITPEGLLVTGAGHPVLGSGGPITVPQAEKIEIGGDGTISIRPVGQEATTLTEVDRIKLVNPPLEQLVKQGDGLMRLRDGGIANPDAEVRITSGVVESSNVNSVEALVNMIELARRFEMQIKMMREAEENDASSAQLMRVSG
ncbi:MAG: flagellar basal body rod protein FlgF [Gammaproteobacteria bacterium]